MGTLKRTKLRKVKLRFKGRKLGAIGKTEYITELFNVTGSHESDWIKAVSEKYQDITDIRLMVGV